MATVESFTHPPGPTSRAPDPRRWLVLVIIATAELMVVLDSSIITIALPSAQRALHISTADRQWVVTAYTLGFGGLLLLGGRIADLIGRKKVFVIGLIGFAGASALGGAAPDSAMLFGARALQGCFGALMAPAALALISVTFVESKERAKAFGVYGAIAGGGAAIGVILGGVLTEFTSWRWCLFVNVPIALVAAAAAVVFVQESQPGGRTRYDILGTVLVSGGLLSLVYGFTKASLDGWTSATTLALLAIAVALLVTFVIVEMHTPTPLLPLPIVLDRSRGGAFVAMLLAGVGLFGMFLFLTYYFQGTLHYSALKSGFAFLPFSLGVIVAAGAASNILPRLGPRPLMVAGFLAAAAGLAWLTQIGVHTSYVTHVLPPEIIISIGLGFVFVPLSSTALIGVAESDAGVASATLNASQMVGFSLGTALLNTVYVTAVARYIDSHGHTVASASAAMVHGYTVGFAVGIVALLAAAVVTLALVNASREQVAAVDAAGGPV